MIESTDSVQRSIGDWTVEYATDFGPRILGVSIAGLECPFASLPGVSIEYEGGTYVFHGGHRLWCAPEEPSVTYRSDDEPVLVEETSEGAVTLTSRPDVEGIVKRLQLTPSGTSLIVDHRLTNTGTSTITLAPWAITQFPPGGTAYLPFGRRDADPNGLVADRALVLWPYTRPTDPELSIEDGIVAVEASSRPSRFKIGTRGGSGWLAYDRAGVMFVKRAETLDGAEYPDLGAAAQCYRDDRFLELETLGPLDSLAPSASIGHREAWSLFDTSGTTARSRLAALDEGVGVVT